MRDLDLRGDFTRDQPIDPERSVLLVIDVQNALLARRNPNSSSSSTTRLAILPLPISRTCS